MPLQYDDEPGSWGRMSEGWPDITTDARAKYVFLNKSKLFPYGSWVIVGDVLRVESEEMRKTLEENYRIVRNAIAQTMLKAV
jgi:hypothetical protein